MTANLASCSTDAIEAAPALISHTAFSILADRLMRISMMTDAHKRPITGVQAEVAFNSSRI